MVLENATLLSQQFGHMWEVAFGSGDLLYLFAALILGLLIWTLPTTGDVKVFMSVLVLLVLGSIVSVSAGVFGWMVGIALMLVGLGAGFAILKVMGGL